MSKEMREQIKKFAEFDINESVEYQLSGMDDISNIVIKNGFKGFDNCANYNIICESSLNRLLDLYARNEWVIITAYITKFSKEENIKRNRKLRGKLNKHKIGPHQLIGSWEECTLKGVDWDKCPKNNLVQTIERSYFVVKPNDMDSQEFKELMLNLMTIDEETQDAIIYCDGDKIYILGSQGQIYDTYTKLTLYKLAQAYSKHIKKQDIPFVFEGLEIPGSNSGRMVMKIENIKYLVG